MRVSRLLAIPALVAIAFLLLSAVTVAAVGGRTFVVPLSGANGAIRTAAGWPSCG